MPNAIVITTAGINCERELAHAFEQAGATADLVHLNRLLARPALLERYELIGLPGGFSYGDAVAAGRVAAQLMRQTLYAQLVAAIERGVPIIAPCNGFQIAVQMGLLPGPADGAPWPETAPRPTVALAQNDSARFVDTWSAIEVPPDTRCIWTQGLELDDETGLLPSAHGEGRFAAPEAVCRALADHGQIAVRYAPGDSPNGSMHDIAGICDRSGLVFGLMPHPERYTRWTQHPWWTRLGERRGEPIGLQMFRNAVSKAGGTASAARGTRAKSAV
jgi:phosphoribosylformylglycinamidine synthase I